MNILRRPLWLRIIAASTTIALAASIFVARKSGRHIANSAGTRLIAFSLTSAERALRRGSDTLSQVGNLAGMTRLLGFVFDRQHQDLILVGRVEPGRRPLDLPSLVVALRAVNVRHQWPLVSIDPTPETIATHKQVVRLEGDIADSRFGQDFVLADVRLKRLGLGLEGARGLEKISYFRLRAEAARRGGGELGGRSRFWFYAVDPGLEQRDDVFVIRKLNLGVRAQTVRAPGQSPGKISTDPPAEIFAGSLTKSFADLCQIFPDIDRLQGLYEMVAVARGVAMLPGSVSEYWLRDYPVPSVPTPRDFDLVGRQERIETASGVRYLEVSGGIQFSALSVRLLDGDVTALKEAVLQSRPATDSTFWSVPLGSSTDFSLRGASQRGATEDFNSGSQLSWEMQESAKKAAQQKERLDKAVKELDKYIRQWTPPVFEKMKEPSTETIGDYHTTDGRTYYRNGSTLEDAANSHGLYHPGADGHSNYLDGSSLEQAANSLGAYHLGADGRSNYLNGSTLEQAATSKGMYNYDEKAGGYKLTHDEGTGLADMNSGGGTSLCITPSCVGPNKQTSDGLKAEPYTRGDLNPYSLHRYFEAGYKVSFQGKTLGDQYGDVQLLGGGRYAAKEWNSAGYKIFDSNGKAISKLFSYVQPIGETGYFAAANEGGLGMTTVFDSQLKPMHTVVSSQLNDYLQGTDFQQEFMKHFTNLPGDSKLPEKVGGIWADIEIKAGDIQDNRRAK